MNNISGNSNMILDSNSATFRGECSGGDGNPFITIPHPFTVWTECMWFHGFNYYDV